MENTISTLLSKKALVLSGGGTLGIAEVGAIVKLEEYGFNLKQLKSVTGSSIGSVLALAIACGASTEYMKHKMNTTNLLSLKNSKCALTNLYTLWKKYGLYEMDAVRKFVKSILKDLKYNEDITFGELYQRNNIWLTVTYLSMNYRRTIYADHIYEAGNSVVDAVIKSCSIPFFYESYISYVGREKYIDIDGGVMLNYPFIVARKQGYDSKEIIGLKFISGKEKEFMDDGQPGTEEEKYPLPENVIDHLKDIIEILRLQAMKVHVSDNDWKNTIKIDIGDYQSTDFNLTESDKDYLFFQGASSVNKYLQYLTDLILRDKY